MCKIIYSYLSWSFKSKTTIGEFRNTLLVLKYLQIQNINICYKPKTHSISQQRVYPILISWLQTPSYHIT